MAMVRVKKVVKTCEACPAQWEGITDDNRQVYVRYRWGCLSIGMGSKDDMSEYAAVDGEEILSIKHGRNLDGTLEYSGMKCLSAGIVEFPESESVDIDWQVIKVK